MRVHGCHKFQAAGTHVPMSHATPRVVFAYAYRRGKSQCPFEMSDYGLIPSRHDRSCANGANTTTGVNVSKQVNGSIRVEWSICLFDREIADTRHLREQIHSESDKFVFYLRYPRCFLRWLSKREPIDTLCVLSSVNQFFSSFTTPKVTTTDNELAEVTVSLRAKLH